METEPASKTCFSKKLHDRQGPKKDDCVSFNHALFSVLDFFTFENGTGMLSCNIGKEFQLYAA
jgi:hypothetical protein